ncbi:MAG: type II toxin-antitoxin system HicB family antitoxin [Candidatus Scalindua sp. AMX11]|nr:MAG: type II toxin-antitoxin system HicB family antitoxin [Candidatus Scalindua sp.]NOG82920.1 type II toxin-antitoxin system HicB family antitoxin [Planctomycetota bacterium]RZV86258.1 MAG: type II toxin-antitoxin system HicB family antitoxin [Candidatus Scalindua sp. SCAELEC01]TDE65881.1 MAG: type II toxin-antitoxin system HicB family antitoxin [Candidatus Scalindua sp. AMX11]GJQ60277.1 MAG: HicB family protein [Candidatus Scalindua sp.]
MLTQYIEKAISKAEYEKLEDESYCGKIPVCSGTIAFGSTLYECQKELRFALEDWLINGLRHGDKIPVIEGINLNPKEVIGALMGTMQEKGLY